MATHQVLVGPYFLGGNPQNTAGPGIAIGAGAGVGLLIGLPFAVIGGTRVKREPVLRAAALVVGPTGARFDVRF